MSFQATQVGAYTCSASNIVGNVNESITVDIRGAPPRNLFITIFGPNSMRVQWSPPESQFLSKLLSYNVLYGIRDLPERQMFSLIGLSTFLNNLEEYTEYEVEIKGVYANGVEGLGITAIGITSETGKKNKSLFQ